MSTAKKTGAAGTATKPVAATQKAASEAKADNAQKPAAKPADKPASKPASKPAEVPQATPPAPAETGAAGTANTDLVSDVVTQELLDSNPELAASGAKVGDPFQYNKNGTGKEKLKDEQYVNAFNEYLRLYGEMPSDQLTAEQLEGFNAEKETEIAAAAKANIGTGDNTADNSAPEAEEFDHENFVMAEKVQADGSVEKKKFNKVTWELLKNSPDGWKISPETPPEVKALQQ